MDDYLHLMAIRDLEVAEQQFRPNNVRNPRNPLDCLNERQFIKLFRLTIDLVGYLVGVLEPYIAPATRATSLSVMEKVLIALKFMASGSYQTDVGTNVYLDVAKSSVSNALKEVTAPLLQPEVFNAWVKFPANGQELNRIRQKFYLDHEFPGVIGCFDCTHVAIVPPKINDPNFLEHLYVNSKNYHSINVQLVCNSNLSIMNVIARYPGSNHDEFIWNNSNLLQTLQQIHAHGHRDYFLLGDSGYPLRSWLLTPFNEVQPNTPEFNYNKNHKKTRVKIECCYGLLKSRFRCLLKHRVLHYAPEIACQIINACVVLHNMCIEYNVPEPDEEENEIETLDFGINEDMPRE